MNARSTRSSVLRLSAAALALAGAACSLFRSLDGFSDEFGASDASTVDAAHADDATTDTADDVPDAPPPPHPRVRCTVTTLASFGGGLAQTSGYMSGLAVSDSFLYVAAGDQSTAPEGGPLPDAGIVLRLGKDGDASVIADGLGPVVGCVAHPKGAACAISGELRLFPSVGDASTLMATRETIHDVSPTTGGAFLATNAKLDGVWLVPWGNEDASVRQPINGPRIVVRADDDGGRVYVARSGANDLSAYPRAAWDDGGWDAGDAALSGCTVWSKRAAQQLAVSKDALYTLGGGSVYRVKAECNVPSSENLNGAAAYAVAADDRFVFVQRPNTVELRWTDDFTNIACGVALDAGIDASPGNETAAFDGDDVYFLAPPHVLKLHITLEP